MNVQQYPSADIPADLACQIASFVRIVWLADAQGEDRFWQVVEPTDGAQHFVIAERGVLISHARVIQHMIEHSGVSYLLYGLGGVFTYPAFRREGYGRQVVDAATAFICSSSADIAMLFCEPKNEAFYQQSGWHSMHVPGVTFGTVDQLRLYDEETVMMQFLSDKAQARRSDFEQQPIHIGASTW